jgi:hypothetical protein
VLFVVRFWIASGAETRMLVSTTYVLRGDPASEFAIRAS